MGLQSHFIFGQTSSIDEQISKMESFMDMGLEATITELDIRLSKPETTTNLAQQSLDYEATVGGLYRLRAVWALQFGTFTIR